jgi:hypothetical protein
VVAVAPIIKQLLVLVALVALVVGALAVMLETELLELLT